MLMSSFSGMPNWIEKELQKLLECLSCRNNINEPKLLRCGHSCCKSCVERISSTSATPGAICCPVSTCSKISKLTSHADNLQYDFRVNRLNEALGSLDSDTAGICANVEFIEALGKQLQFQIKHLKEEIIKVIENMKSDISAHNDKVQAICRLQTNWDFLLPCVSQDAIAVQFETALSNISIVFCITSLWTLWLENRSPLYYSRVTVSICCTCITISHATCPTEPWVQ